MRTPLPQGVNAPSHTPSHHVKTRGRSHSWDNFNTQRGKRQRGVKDGTHCGVADALEGLQIPSSPTTIYENVQAAGQHVRRLHQQRLKEQKGEVQVVGVAFTHVKCLGQDKIIGVATALLTGEVVALASLGLGLVRELGTPDLGSEVARGEERKTGWHE